MDGAGAQLPNLPPGTEVWIKRDDLSGMQLSGNRVITFHEVTVPLWSAGLQVSVMVRTAVLA
jgi:hypothetical protein